jgi:hypothetical protein
MRERQLQKIQKQRHMSDILLMLLNNSVFKNLNPRERKQMAALIYKAEMIEMAVRNRKIVRVNESFQDIMNGLLNSGAFDDFEDDEDDGLFGK